MTEFLSGQKIRGDQSKLVDCHFLFLHTRNKILQPTNPLHPIRTGAQLYRRISRFQRQTKISHQFGK